MIKAFDLADPPVAVAADLLYTTLSKRPRRLAFAGPAGAGKTELCRCIAGTSEFLEGGSFLTHPPVPIVNHADGIKEEVLEWVAKSRTRALIPGEKSTFESFCDFLGLSPGMVEHHMWELMGPLWLAMNQLLEDAYEYLPPLAAWAQYKPGESVEAKVAFVDQHKPLFRTALQRYGQVIKDITANPYYWVEQTITRGITHPFCLNGDTRFPEELELLRNTGWVALYIAISPETQKLRRPDLTDEQLAHISENAITPEMCDAVIDGNQKLGRVLFDILDYLGQVSQVVVL